jgi:uncharacterized membrane protein YbhN (UPF0104 family)
VDPQEIQSKPRSTAPLLRWLGTLISFALLIYLLSRQGWVEIWRALNSISPLSFGLAIGLLLVSRLMVCGRWYTLLKTGGQNISVWITIRLVFAGLFASNFLPTTIGGDVVRLAGAVRRKYDSSVITASLVADRLIGMVGMASLLPIGIPYLANAQAALPPGDGLIPLTSFFTLGTINRLLNKTRVFLQSTLKALLIWIHKPFALLMALLWTFGHQAALFTTVWVLFLGMGEDISWWVVAGLWIFNYFITLLPISINGMGVQELTIAYIYTRFGGVSPDSGLVLAIIMRALYLIASLPGVFTLPEILNSRKANS